MKKTITLLCFLVFVALVTSRALGQCNFNQRTILSHTTFGLPSLTTFNNRLFLGWSGTDSNRTVNVASSADGFNYDSHRVLTNMTTPGGGIGLAGSSGCGQIYLAFVGRDPDSTMNMSRSSDGVNWATQVQVQRFTTTPVLIGYTPGGTSGVLGFVYRTPDNIFPTFVPAAVTVNNCSLTSFDLNACFVNGVAGCDDRFFKGYGPPGWASTGTKEVRTLSRSSSDAEPNDGQIYYSVDLGPFTRLGTEWTLDTPSTTIDPANSQFYVAWRGGLDNKINVQNVSTGQKLICDDWSERAPALAVFNNQLFVAWKGGDNKINVASMNLF